MFSWPHLRTALLFGHYVYWKAKVLIGRQGTAMHMDRLFLHVSLISQP